MLISSSNAFTADASDKLWELIQLINDQEDSYHLPPAEVSFLVLDKKIKLLLRCLDEGNISYVNLMEKSKVEEKAANAKASTELQLTLSIWKFIAKL